MRNTDVTLYVNEESLLLWRVSCFYDGTENKGTSVYEGRRKKSFVIILLRPPKLNLPLWPILCTEHSLFLNFRNKWWRSVEFSGTVNSAQIPFYFSVIVDGRGKEIIKLDQLASKYIYIHTLYSYMYIFRIY